MLRISSVGTFGFREDLVGGWGPGEGLTVGATPKPCVLGRRVAVRKPTKVVSCTNADYRANGLRGPDTPIG